VPTKNKLTDESWRKVFSIRCRSKQGQPIPSAELGLYGRAMREDPARYEAMGADVFEATVPFGSTVKAKR
jgi:hypothetical protein